MSAPDQRMAFLCIENDSGRKVTKVADFGLMTLSINSQGGYGDREDITKSITPAAAAAFWSAFPKILPLRAGDQDQLDGATWDAKFHDGETIRTEKGCISDDNYVGTLPGAGSYHDILRLFDLLA
jgi:hypothetical protein